MRFLMPWVPTLVGMVLIMVAGLVLVITERRAHRGRRSNDS